MCPSNATAGAWTLGAGEGQVVVTGTLSAADRAFDDAGSLQSIPRYDKSELQALIEYGATDRLTLMAAPSLQHVDIAAPVDAQRTGLGFSDFGARYRFLQEDSWVLSGQTTLRVPGTFQKANPAAIGYTDPELDIRALLGYAFPTTMGPAFFDAQLAHRARFGAQPSEVHADLTVGVRPLPDWLLLAQSFNVWSEGGGGPGFTSYDYYKFQLSAVYAVTPAWSLQIGGFSTYAGHNALRENGIIVGSWHKF
jgi:hypothetical protein